MPRTCHQAYWLVEPAGPTGPTGPTGRPWPGNGDWSNTNFWVYGNQTYLNRQATIGGFPTPAHVFPANTSDFPATTSSLGTGYFSVDTTIDNGSQIGIYHGPYIVSKNYEFLNSGEKVTFNYTATGTKGCGYDIYVYLLRSDGTAQTLASGFGTADKSDSNTITRTINISGNYKFVYIHGGWNASGVFSNGRQPVAASSTLGNITIT